LAKHLGIYYFSNPMAKLEAGTTLKRLRNRYRLLVMNDDTYEEVVTFKLSRLSVYIMLCSIFVLLVGLTVALMVFTDIKYYLPGNDEVKIGREYKQLKYRTDSLERQVILNAQYLEDIKKVLSGSNTIVLDTNKITVPRDEFIND
jgi:hypothetical protein